MRWKVALIDSCGRWPGASVAAAFESRRDVVELVPVGDDPTGHGSAIAALLMAPGCLSDLLLGQVFLRPGATTPAAVAAAIDWSVSQGARLVHLSLGVSADRAIMGRAVANAVAAGCILVASTPARGAPAFPAAYPGVIRATGDARCSPGQWSAFEDGTFGGCVQNAAGDVSLAGRGASIGAAWISRAILGFAYDASLPQVVAALTAGATHRGRERRGASSAEPT